MASIVSMFSTVSTFTSKHFLLTAHTILGQQASPLTTAMPAVPTTFNTHDPQITNPIAFGVVTVWMSPQGLWAGTDDWDCPESLFQVHHQSTNNIPDSFWPVFPHSLMFSLFTARDELYT